MSFIFSNQQWNKIRSDSDLWWQGKLDRPLIQVRLNKRPDVKMFNFQSFYPLEVPPGKILDDWEIQLDATEHMGDAFPRVWPNFGPGVIAAFLGAELNNGQETVWFEPQQIKPIGEIDFSFSTDNKWYRRIRDIIAAGLDRWKGGVQIGLTDLGGNLDILASFRPGEKLLLDLYDSPDEVERLTWKAHDMWWRYFTEFDKLTSGVNPGCCAWAGIFSTQPHYMLQCDFCYMIGPDMFEKFVKPELQSTCDKLTNAFYHLDGPGQLVHLDSLLEIESLKGVQWIPGAGSADATNWPEVYKKISEAGKKIQILSPLSEKPFDETLDIITDQIGRADNIVYHIYDDISQRDRAEKLLAKYC